MLIDKYIRRHRGPNVVYSRGTESVVDKSADHAKSLWVFLTTMEAQSPSLIKVKITLNHCGFFNHNGGTESDVNKNTDHAKSLWFS